MADVLTIAGMRDVETIEAVPFRDRVVESSTFAVIEKGAAMNPEAVAISFLMNGDAWDQPHEVTYKELIHNIRRCANMFHDLGVGPDGRGVVPAAQPSPDPRGSLGSRSGRDCQPHQSACWSRPRSVTSAGRPEPAYWWPWGICRGAISGTR